MMYGAVTIPIENGDGGVLSALAVFASQIVFECAISGAQQTQSVPATRAGVGSQGCRIGSGDNREVDILSDVVSDSVDTVDPRGAHRTRFGLTFPVHQVIYHQRPVRCDEEIAQPDGSRWCIA